MVRLNSIQRQAPPTSIEPYCLDTDSIDVAAKYRIVIATCVTAGGFHRLSLGVGHFTHIFVDEAGQATEPECLLPISLSAGFSDSVVGILIRQNRSRKLALPVQQIEVSLPDWQTVKMFTEYIAVVDQNKQILSMIVSLPIEWVCCLLFEQTKPVGSKSPVRADKASWVQISFSITIPFLGLFIRQFLH